jgi:hypothetical protein
MLRDMLPQSSAESRRTGLVDIEVGTFAQTRDESHLEFVDQLKHLLTAPSTSSAAPACAPWCRPAIPGANLIAAMCHAKREAYTSRPTPLLHYRNEELSQMLLDCKHPTRSQRYHTRRYAFIRKVKNAKTKTPARYMGPLAGAPDEEELEHFDQAPGWVRGEEWGWVGLPTPPSLVTSESTRIPLYPSSAPLRTEMSRKDSQASQGSTTSSRPGESVASTDSSPNLQTPLIDFAEWNTGLTLDSPKRDSQEEISPLDKARPYVEPKIPGSHECEFPCLYEP